MLSGLMKALGDADRRSPFGVDVAASLGTEVLKIALAAATGILLARQLGPAGRGEFAAVMSWAGLLAFLARLSTDQAVVHFVGREPSKDGRWMGSALALSLAGGLPVVAAGAWILPRALADERPAVVEVALVYLLVYFVIQSVRLTWISSLRGRRKIKHWNALRLLANLGWLVALVVGVLWAREDSVWYVYAYLVVMGLLTVVVVRVGERHRVGELSASWSGIRATAKYSVPLAAASVPQQLQNEARLGQLLIVAMADPRAAGLFAVAASWSRILRPVTHALPSVMFPYVSGSESPGEGAGHVRTGIQVTVIVAGVAGFLLLVAAPVAVPLLYGPSFGAAVPAALVLVAGGMVRAVGEAAESGLRGFGRTGAILRMEIAGVAVGAAAMVPLIAAHGLMGAAVASALGFCVTSAGMTYAVTRTTEISPSEFVPSAGRTRAVARGVYRELRRIWRERKAGD